MNSLDHPDIQKFGVRMVFSISFSLKNGTEILAEGWLDYTGKNVDSKDPNNADSYFIPDKV